MCNFHHVCPVEVGDGHILLNPVFFRDHDVPRHLLGQLMGVITIGPSLCVVGGCAGPHNLLAVPRRFRLHPGSVIRHVGVSTRWARV